MPFVIIELLILLIITLVGVARFRRYVMPIKVLIVIVFITLISESIATILSYSGHTNMPVYHFYLIILFWTYALFYYHLFTKARIRLIVLVIPVLYTLFALINTLYFQKLNTFPAINAMLYHLFLFVCSILYLKNAIDLNPFEPSYKNPIFLINAVGIGYFTLQVIMLGVFNILFKARGIIVMPVWIISMTADILYYSTIGYTIIWSKKDLTVKKL